MSKDDQKDYQKNVHKPKHTGEISDDIMRRASEILDNTTVQEKDKKEKLSEIKSIFRYISDNSYLLNKNEKNSDEVKEILSALEKKDVNVAYEKTKNLGFYTDYLKRRAYPNG